MQFLSLFAQKGRSRHLASIFLGLACLLALGAPGFGQTDTGSIVGTVQDATHAVVVGAQVDITDSATNVTHTFVTNADGGYQALQLIPGVYSVKASHAGYSTGVRDNVTIDVQTRAQVDIMLTVG